MLGQGQGDPVGLFLVIEAAVFGRGDVHHQRKRPGRRLQHGQRTDVAGIGADQVDHPVADQEPAVVMEQFPGKRQQSHIIAADRDHRPGPASDGGIPQENAPGIVEEQIEEDLPQRGGVLMQLDAVRVGLDRLAGQSIVHNLAIPRTEYPGSRESRPRAFGRSDQ